MVTTPAPTTDSKLTAPATATANGHGEKGTAPRPGQASSATKAYHVVTAEDAVRTLESDTTKGLSNARAAELLSHYGANELEGGSGIPIWKVRTARPRLAPPVTC